MQEEREGKTTDPPPRLRLKLGTQLDHREEGLISVKADRYMEGCSSPYYRYLLSLDSCQFAVGDLPSCQLSEN